MTPHSLPIVLALSPIGKVTSYLHCAYISISNSAPHTCIFNLREGTPSQNGDDVILRGGTPLFSPSHFLRLRCRHSYGSTQQNSTTNAPDFGPEETHENLKQMERAGEILVSKEPGKVTPWCWLWVSELTPKLRMGGSGPPQPRFWWPCWQMAPVSQTGPWAMHTG